MKVLINGLEKCEIGTWFEKEAEVRVLYYSPLTEEEIQASHPGQIRIQNASGYYIGKQYETVLDELKSNGFVNFEVLKLADLKRGWLNTKDRTAALISIDGAEKFDKETWFSKEAKVRLIYHVYAD